MPKFDVNTSTPFTLGGVPAGSEGLVLADILQQTEKDALHICTHDRALEAVAKSCAFFAPHIETLSFPAWDCLPYDRASPVTAITAERIITLSALANPHHKKPRIILTTINAILQKLPPREVMQQAAFSLHRGETLNRDALLEFLVHNGYRRTGKVIEPGEFALRGSIIDLFAPGDSEGRRIDLFGDSIESIRLFDPLTQVSAGHTESLTLHPVNEVLLTPENIERFRLRYREQFGAVVKEDPLYESISEARAYIGMEHWLPLFYDKLDTLFDYIPNAVVTLAHQIQHTAEERFETITDHYQARRDAPRITGAAPYNPLPPDALYFTPAAWELLLERHPAITFSPFSEGGTDMGYKTGRNFAAEKPAGGSFEALRHYINNQQRPVLITCFSAGSLSRLQHLCTEHDIPTHLISGWAELKRDVNIAVFELEHGFETPNAVLISEQDILGERLQYRTRKKRKSEAFMAEAASFLPGELVVHKEHGIARFDGLITLEVSGARHDCLKLVYADEDKLFLPIENSELVSRYGMEDENAKLDKLGSASWQSRKARMKERITLAAEELMKTAAERAVKPAEVLSPAEGMYEEFCARFPYMETEDQERSIEEVREDLSAGKPMDRLICGDVGFGKTEVAMRAAFIATCMQEHKVQVALVAPTTLLARQHYKTFVERFAGFPVTIRQLSRMVGTKAAKETREQLAEGKVDIVIGTHALLAKDIKFKNLGLLIVDEEQHFGVAQKEKLKSLKADVHVLTLSATPIPRTLQMALSGVRELSLITTPPVDRLAIRSFVMPFDPVVIREAILREYHRGGKTFYVTPRIADIGELKQMLSELVPEIKMVVAHGGLAPTQLDKIMNEFYDGKADLLLSTAIIESGIDIPTANTIIINRSDRFGLSQLYQLRGRVGRSKTRAYAYFTLPHKRQLTEAAVRRLEVMQGLDTLGAGFTIASHDMDIRGFGNLVGEEQSGQVREVGIELYQQMLEEAVNAIKHQKTGAAVEATDEWSPQINIGMSVLIPEEYVADLNLRLGLYRRAAALATEEEIHAFAVELVDRFGPLPEEVEHLLAVMRIKQLCLQAGVERVDAGPKGAVITFRKNKFARPEALLKFIAENTGLVKLRPDHKLVFAHDWEDETAKLKGVDASIAQIAKLAA